MTLEWLRRDNAIKDHALIGDEYFGAAAPSIIYERRPVLDPQGRSVPKLFAAWIWLNNPAQFNSYTTEMLKGLSAGFQRASSDREVVAVVMTGVGEKGFCTGGNIADFAALRNIIRECLTCAWTGVSSSHPLSRPVQSDA